MHGRTESDLAKLRRDTVGIIFQSFHLIPTLTAVENVALPLEFKGVENAVALASDKLDEVGLGHRLTHYPGQFQAANNSALPLRGPWLPAPRSFSPMSPPATSTRKPASQL